MECDDLGGLRRDERLELVCRQQQVQAEREAAVERRDEKIREVEEELSQFRRLVKTPASSSVPLSRGQKANRVKRRGRRSGAKRGYVGVSRVRSKLDVVLACRLSASDECGEPLPDTGGGAS